MSYYDDGLDKEDLAQYAFSQGRYKACVSMCCQAADLFLKQKLSEIDAKSPYEKDHDFVAIYGVINNKYPSSEDLKFIMYQCRKYYTESGYSGRFNKTDSSVYTKDFANEFICFLQKIKQYIDMDCSEGLKGLAGKYEKRKDI